MSSSSQKTGGQILVDMLVANGARQAFCVPGESYLPVLDALRDAPIKLHVCRQESGAAMMAEAQGKLTGKPGICFVTRGPGATNASAGVHIACQDSTPMILFIGQVERGFMGREAFQEIDYAAFFSPIAKWAAEIREAERIPEFINRAYAVATSGRPGPVVLALPEDMLADLVTDAVIAPHTPVRHSADEAAISHLTQMLDGAKAPLLLLGGSTWNEMERAAIQSFAENWQLPVAVSFRRQNLFDSAHPNFAGHVGIGADADLQKRIRGADVLIMLGGRFSEMPSQSYTLIDIQNPKQQIVHVHPDPEELGRVYRPKLAICARAGDVATALALTAPSKSVAWKGEAEKAHAAFKNFTMPTQNPGSVQMAELVLEMAKQLGDDAVICNGAGNYGSWIHRFYPFRKMGTQLAPTSGSMGYGLPAAVGAKALMPERKVVCFAGDGDIMMTVQEFATAVQYDLPIVVIVIDNGLYGTIRMHQEKHYPGRAYGVDLKNPDFAAMARSFGGAGFTVKETKEFAPAFAEAIKGRTPALIHVLIDPEAITPTSTLSSIRASAQRA